MIKLLTSPWLTAPIGAVLYLGFTVLFWKMPVPPPPEAKHATVVQNGASWEFSNPEADQLMNELNEEKKALELQKQELDETDKQIRSRQAELNDITKNIQRLQAEFDQSVVRVREEETPNLKKLAKVYADMSPTAAASVMAEMDDANIVKIMLFMKESEAAAILETMATKGQPDAKRAAALSERVRLSTSHTTASK